MAIDSLAQTLRDAHLEKILKPLFYSSTNVIGVGIRGQRPERVSPYQSLLSNSAFM
jgi:hypothetical protein